MNPEQEDIPPAVRLSQELDVERSRNQLLTGQVSEMLARIRWLENKHGEPLSAWHPIT